MNNLRDENTLKLMYKCEKCDYTIMKKYIGRYDNRIDCPKCKYEKSMLMERIA